MKNIHRRVVSLLLAFSMTSSIVSAAPANNLVKQPNGKPFDSYQKEHDTAIESGTKWYENSAEGLHTDKTVTKYYEDGRTFDLNLEAWQVGVTAADVAMVLDASGSMAWASDPLNPMSTSDGSIDSKYIYNEGSEYYDGKFLKDEVVEEILNNKLSDYTPLSYSGYSYYVYDPRGSVQEFVPLGYWDGTTPSLSGLTLLGYNSFDDTLGNGAYINRVSTDSGSSFTDDPTTGTIEKSPTFNGTEFDLDATAAEGGVLLGASPSKSSSLTVSFRYRVTQTGQSKDIYSETPILYIGSLDGTNYIEITRSGSDARRIRVRTSAGDLNFNTVVVDQNGANTWMNIHVVYDSDSITVYFGDNSTAQTLTLSNSVDLTNAKIIVGGDVKNYDGSNFSNIDLTDLCIFDRALQVDEIKKLNTNTGGSHGYDIKKVMETFSGDEDLIGYYDFDDGVIENELNKDEEIKYIEQASGGKFDETKTVSAPAAPQYVSDGYKGSALNVTQTAKGGAVNLNIDPPSDNTFTVSFAIKKANGDKDFTTPAELMYIGDSSLSQYYRIARNDSSINDIRHLRFFDIGVTNPNSSNPNISNVFNGSEWSVITYVFDGTTVTAYKDGAQAASATITEYTASDPMQFIIAGLQDEYEGTDIYIDELYVYDEALKPSQVKVLVNGTDSDTSVASDENGVVFSQLGDGYADSSRSKGWYYVNSSGTWSLLESTGTGKQYKGLLKSEYYYDSKTADKDKRITEDNYHTGIIVPPALEAYEGNSAGPEITYDDLTLQDGNTVEAIKFFVDTAGNLRCLMNSGGNSTKQYSADDYLKSQRTYVSYVYFKPADSLIKAQMLDSALDDFISQLNAKSPKSRISAVRFSTDDVINGTGNKFSQLQMLEWTNVGTANIKLDYPGEMDRKYEVPSTDYPYALTGGTAAWTGIEAFMKYLGSEAGRKVDGQIAKKYIILFTDGVDDTINESKKASDFKDQNAWGGSATSYESNYATLYANDLKNATGTTNTVTSRHESTSTYKIKKETDDEEGYTIFTVMLTGGSESQGDNVKTFLSGIASEDEKGITEGDKLFFDSSDLESLNQAFKDILQYINEDLENYVVQDYIDPRFDLVDGNGQLVELKKGGPAERDFLCEIKEETDDDGNTEKVENWAKLCYDSDADMYYLKWTDCTIPTTGAPDKTINGGEASVDVWSSNITIKAKKDFIGGNSVLTNGNADGMNLVYSSKDNRAKTKDGLKELSGTQYMVKTDTNEYVAKGFPRTTVNVRLKDMQTEAFEDVIYLGEIVSPQQMLRQIENNYMTDSYYLEYLGRYAKRIGSRLGETENHEQLISLLNYWLQIDKEDGNNKVKSFTIPYMYLPNSQGTNNTGDPNVHERDILGILTYEWEKLDPPDDKNADPLTHTAKIDPYISYETEQIKYSLTIRYTPLTENDDFNDPDFKFITVENTKNDKTNVEGIDDIFFGTDLQDISEKAWTFGTRKQYNASVITEGSYHWYKDPVGYIQLEDGQTYKVDEKSNIEKIDGNTIEAMTTYTKDVVSGGLALEICVPVGDLRKAIEQNGNGGGYKKSFSVNAKRTYVHSPEDQKLISDYELSDYGEDFTFTYEINYSLAQINSLTAGKKDTDYVSLFATVDQASPSYIDVDFEGDGSASTTQLPIGTYTIDLSSIDDLVFVEGNGDEKKTFNKIYGDGTPSYYTEDRFTYDVYDNDQDAENKGKWEIDDDLAKTLPAGNRVVESDYIADYANAKGLKSVSYYLGTADNNGNKLDDESYIDKRLGIICLSYGDNSLTLTKNVKNSEDYNETDWEFDITLYSDLELDTENYTVEYKDSEDNVIAGKTKPSLTPAGGTSGNYEYTLTVTIKHGESFTIKDLVAKDPAVTTDPKIKFKISEKDNAAVTDSYDVDFVIGDNSTGETVEGTIGINTQVDCNNIFPITLPTTGGTGTRGFMMIGGGMVIFAGAALVYLSMRKKRRNIQNAA